MFMSVSPTCMCLYYVQVCTGRGQRRAMGLHELEFQMVVNCHVDAENCTWVFWKDSQCFYLSIIFPAPSYSDS